MNIMDMDMGVTRYGLDYVHCTRSLFTPSPGQLQRIYGVHLRLLPIHLTIYTRPNRTGTSIKGPTVDANAWSLSAPYVATATAIASSKLLLAAVKL